MLKNKKSKKIILGLAGEIAAGKDTVAAYLKKKYGAETVSFSVPLRDILDRIHLPHTRINMSDLGQDLRKRFGHDILSRVIAADVIASKAKIIALPNIRLFEDIVHLKKIPGFRLVAVNTDMKTRFQRLKKRGQNADDKSKTWPQFVKDSKLYTEIHIRDIMKKSKHQLDNNGNFDDLYKQVEELLKKLK